MHIIITGASRGIGKAIAEIFAKENKHTLFICARNTEPLEKFAAQIKQQYPGTLVHSQCCDVADKRQLAHFADFILSFNKCIDMLVNNAGIFIPGSVYNEPEGTLEKMLNVNLLSAYHFTRLLMPRLLQQKGGIIFNICSIASLKAYANGGSYSISKYALAGFTQNLRQELKAFGIKVCGVYPGAVMTDSWAGSGIDPARIMHAEDIAKMIYAATQLSPQAVVEDIVLRPQLGDL